MFSPTTILFSAKFSYTEATPKANVFFYPCIAESATPEIIRGMRLSFDAVKTLKMEQVCVQHKRVFDSSLRVFGSKRCGESDL